jgi:hypothetical protein
MRGKAVEMWQWGRVLLLQLLLLLLLLLRSKSQRCQRVGWRSCVVMGELQGGRKQAPMVVLLLLLLMMMVILVRGIA